MTATSQKPLNQTSSDKSIVRIKQLLEQGLLHADIVRILNEEGFTTIREQPWTAVNLRQVLWKLRWQERTWYGVSARRAGLDIAQETFPC